MVEDLIHKWYSQWGLDYFGRLKVMTFTTLETRRLRVDLIEVFKILNALEASKVLERINFVRYVG